MLFYMYGHLDQVMLTIILCVVFVISAVPLGQVCPEKEISILNVHVLFLDFSFAFSYKKTHPYAVVIQLKVHSMSIR